MTKELIAERIYSALKNVAGDQKEISIRKGFAAASVATNMPISLINSWLDSMEVLGWIHRDGVSIWLSRDYGPRVHELSPEEKAIIEGQKVPEKSLERAKKILGK